MPRQPLSRVPVTPGGPGPTNGQCVLRAEVLRDEGAPVASRGTSVMTEPPARYDDLSALFINCTLKRSPDLSHTGGLVDISRSIMDKHGVSTDVIRAVDHDIATGVWP